MILLLYIIIGLAVFLAIRYHQNKYKKSKYFYYIIIALLVVVVLLIRGAISTAAIISLFTALYAIFIRLQQAKFLINASQNIFGKKSTRKNGQSQYNGTMDLQTAAEIIGVDLSNTSREEIMHNYKKLMKRNHPDNGGSNYLAEQINIAKDIIIKEIGE
jgi:fatty-acid desaturase